MLSPAFALAVFSLISLLALAGMQRLEIANDVQSQLVGASQSERAWRRYVASFPAESRHLLLMLERPFRSSQDAKLLARLHQGLLTLPGVARVHSAVDDPRIAWRDTDSQDSHREAKRWHPVLDRLPTLLAARRDAALLMVEPHEHILDDSALLIALVDSLRARAAITLSVDVRSVHVAGLPLIRAELDGRVRHELTRMTLFACIAAALVACFCLRSWREVLVCLPLPVVALAWTLGAMGWLGLPLTILAQVVLSLVMAVVFADALHLLHHVHHPYRAACSREAICQSALSAVGPACLFTSLTTVAGLLSLQFSGLAALRDFSLAGACGSLLGLVLVLLALPWMVRWRPSSAVDSLGRPHRSAHEAADGKGTQTGRNPDRWHLPRRMDPMVLAASGLLTLALLVNASWLRPGWSLEANLPDDSALADSLQRIEARFSVIGAEVVELRAIDERVSTRRLAAQLARLERQLESATGREWLSVLDLARALPGFGLNLRITALPRELREPLWNRQDAAALLLAIPDGTRGSAAGRTDGPAADTAALAAMLQAFMADEPRFSARRVGLLQAMAHSGHRVSIELALSLLSATGLLTVLCGRMLGAWKLGVLALLPSVAPLALVGATLVWLGEPLRQAWVALFLVLLGLSVDSSIHLLLCWRRAVSRGVDVCAATREALNDKAPVLVRVTAVSLGAFLPLTLSSITTLALAGWLLCAALLFALILTLCGLPAILRLPVAARAAIAAEPFVGSTETAGSPRLRTAGPVVDRRRA